jgi:hypothetical protein
MTRTAIPANGGTLPVRKRTERRGRLHDPPGRDRQPLGEITRAYREHAADEARIAAVPGRVLGSDIEGQADALEEAAARLGELLTAFTGEPRRSMDAIAVFRVLSRAADSMRTAADELRRQEWFDLDDPEAAAAWNSALDGLRSASRTFGWVADGWI